MKTLWTLIVKGGQPLTLRFKGNPPLVHQGPHSVLKLISTEEESRQVASKFEEGGSKVQVVDHRETPDQKQERVDYLSLVTDPTVKWKTPMCAQCAWFDRDLEGMCGLGRTGQDSWPPETIEIVTGKFQEDADLCPLKSN